MTRLFSCAFLLFYLAAFAQKPCDFSTNVTDSLGVFKATKDQIMYEKNFGGTQTYIFFSLQVNNGLPSLNMKLITKSREFVRANCFDKNSRLYLQLDNGKIVTLMHAEAENCGSPLIEDGFTTRVNIGYFLFVKGSIEDLKSSPISLMRIRYATETIDYVLRSSLTSELTKETYFPQTFFRDNLKCIFD